MTVSTLTLPSDQPARDRIRTDLGTNMLVEAGAGSGKTTSLVDRMLEHVRTGTPVDRITAVTFTRKAANELRERFQLRLEGAARDAEAGNDESSRYTRALRELDRAFLGTIHAFCARILRERPLEVGLDPGFQEVTEDAWEELTQRFWRRWVERASRANDAGLVALRNVGIEPYMLYDGFKTVMTYPDVDFPVGASARPDAASCQSKLNELLTAARRAMPVAEPGAGWDALMSLVRRLEFRRSIGKLDDLVGFCDALDTISASACKATQNRWSDDREGKKQAKALSESFVQLLEGPIADLLRCWREHRYPIVMEVLQRASADFARERHSAGTLGFEDLLLLTAKLLRDNATVRDELGARYAHLLVDEFQDTDPIQAEVCFLLTSGSSEGSDWRTVTPRPGSLFVVGDPKQSIFRFRRADIGIYDTVKRRMRTFGAELHLTANFRSVSSIEAIVNTHFVSVFPAEPTAEQAPFRPMESRKEPTGNDGVYTHVVRPTSRRGDEVLELDAAKLASLIEDRLAAGTNTAGDFMILTRRRSEIASYARALTERNVPVTTTGAKLRQEYELRELLVVLRALADPERAIGVVAALEGLLFGVSPADLWDASRRGIAFSITRPPLDDEDATAHALAQLHEWWLYSQRHPADVLLERILDESGLLLHAAALPLGEARAGALLHLVESLRVDSVLGGNGLPDAMARLESVLGAEAADAPLRPGRSDAVRVMNLHKAKGLEAEVVMLAAPVDRTVFEPDVHVTRGETGRAIGGLLITHRGDNSRRVLAHPPHWAVMQADEANFAEAEAARLLYVAATRAKRELWVSQCEKHLTDRVKPDDSIWRPLAPVLEDYASPRELRINVAPGRAVVTRSAASLAQASAEAAERMRVAATSSMRFVSVTREAKGNEGEQPVGALTVTERGHGKAWGRAVHRALEAMGRGRTGTSLESFVRAVAADEALDADQAASLYPLIVRTAGSPAWLALRATDAPSVELTVMRAESVNGVTSITEGVIDAALLGPDGWRVVDWKTDDVGDETWHERADGYTRQVGEYARMLTALTGQPATGEVERIV